MARLACFSASSFLASRQFSWEDGFADLFIIYSMQDMCVMVALMLHCRLPSVCKNYIQNYIVVVAVVAEGRLGRGGGC